MLSLVEQAVRPTIAVRASNSETGGIIVDLTQADVVPSQRAVAEFFDDEPATGRPGGYEAAIGALAARALAERHAGTATFQAIDGGSRLTLVVMRRS